MPGQIEIRNPVFSAFVQGFRFQVLSLEYEYSIQHSFEGQSRFVPGPSRCGTDPQFLSLKSLA